MTSPERKLFTSESVTQGHPDKICDQISDSVLDAILAQDAGARVAVETLITAGLVHVTGEITTSSYVEIPAIVRATLMRIGYDSAEAGIDGASCGVSTSIKAQSPDIAHGVASSWEARHGGGEVDLIEAQGAGDQGLIFGYASDETAVRMPLPILAAHRLASRLEWARRCGAVHGLRPDGKTQVTVAYEGARPVDIDTVVVSAQHAPNLGLDELEAGVRQFVIEPVLADLGYGEARPRVLVNPAGPFVVGGPEGDAGLTGRKIIVDTYGGMARHGGGAFSGKDPSKVDRSAAYAMRWVASNVVAAGLAARCEVQIAYAIGASHPVGLYVETFGTGQVSDVYLAKAIEQVFDLRPAAIVRDLDLLRPIYLPTATYGHFGRDDQDFTWERTDRVEALLAAVT